MDERQRGMVLGIVAYVVWGFLTIYWKALEGLDPIQLIGARVISSLVLLSVILSVTHRWARMRPLANDRPLLRHVAIAAVLLTCNWTAYVWAVVHDHVMETALGYFISPLGTVLIGVALFGEKVRPAQRVALGLAAAAVLELTVAYGRVPVLALLIAVSWSIYGLMKRRVPLPPIESLAGETMVLVVPAIAVLVVPAAAGNGLTQQATGAQLALLSLSGVATCVPLLMFAAAAKRVPFTILGPIQYLVPSINFLLGIFVYHEPVDARVLFGFALVWIGLVVFSLDTVRASRRLDVDVVQAPGPEAAGPARAGPDPGDVEVSR